MKKNSFMTGAVIMVSLAPLVYLAAVWNSIPQTVALHFNEKMQPDKMGDKSELWIPVGILTSISIGVFFLLSNISRIDPKQKNAGSPAVFNKLAAGLVVFMSALNFILITSAFKGSITIEKFLFPLIGLLFAFIGNYMNNIKPNYFAGIRLPWTLSDDDNWRRTHHLASKIWFAGGIAVAIISVLLPIKMIIPIFVCLVIIMVMIPAVYSYRLYKEKNG